MIGELMIVSSPSLFFADFIPMGWQVTRKEDGMISENLLERTKATEWGV